ncbi:DUF664 domain-containing protein [Streptomyces sp. NPDC056683]|uniref:mycothiol transferase n=1 Tax=Streptomyces sp. NPDC056683 TaxID=3345910 RepID=UPI0036B6F19D
MIASNLDYHRATFLWKCEGLSDEQLRLRPVRSSALTPPGAHAPSAGAERAWFQRTLAGTTPRLFPYRTYVTADGDEWYDESDAMSAGDVYPEFGDTDVRFVLEHVIEEYARHAGHADLLREAIDGATGEQPSAAPSKHASALHATHRYRAGRHRPDRRPPRTGSRPATESALPSRRRPAAAVCRSERRCTHRPRRGSA